MPRIIAGNLKGMNLLTAAGRDTRPTSDRAKEALFSILAERIRGAKVLDLFAGSGQIALESISRGAELAVVCETNKAALKALFANIEKTSTSEVIKVFAYDARRVVKKLIRDHYLFDLVYLDPPWAKLDELIGSLEPLLSSLLSENAVIVVESEAGSNIPEYLAEGLLLRRSCAYGASVLSFYYYEHTE